MPLNDVMRQFAELVGRALTRRWLHQRGLAPRPESEPGQKHSETTEADRPPPSQGLTTDASPS